MMMMTKVKLQTFCVCIVYCLLALSSLQCVTSDDADVSPKRLSEIDDEGSNIKYDSPDVHAEGVDDEDGLFQDLDGVLDQMATSKDQMMSDFMENMAESRTKMMEGFDSVMDKMLESRAKMVKGFDSVMGKMSESHTNVMKGIDSVMDKMSNSRAKMMEGLDSMMEKMSESKEKMIRGLDNVLEQVSNSKMMEEIDHVLESVSHSKLMEDLRAFPQEIRESFILDARNESYLIAGVLVAITAAILLSGAIYYAWCHHDAWSYYIGTIEDAKALLCQAKESGFGRSTSSSESDIDDTTSETAPLLASSETNGDVHRNDVMSSSNEEFQNGVITTHTDHQPSSSSSHIGSETRTDMYKELVSDDQSDIKLLELENRPLENGGHLRKRNGSVICNGDTDISCSNGGVDNCQKDTSGVDQSHLKSSEVFDSPHE